MAASAVLGLIFAAAATAKWRDRRRLEAYLRPVVSRCTTALARGVVAGELMVAGLLGLAAAEPSLRPLAAEVSATFLVLATGVHAVRLSGRETPTCHCFGRLSAPSDRIDASWRPALFALRNGALVGLSADAGGWPVSAGASVASLILALIAGALIVSTIRERALLAREVHPTAELYGPRMRTLMAHTWWVNGHPRPF